MKHSSMENFWRTGEQELQMSIKPSEQRLYQAQSALTIFRPGQVRRAIVTGWAVLMPSFFAGMDAAVMMLLRSEGSPATTEGTRRMSPCPSSSSFTADQLRKAEFTSIWNITLLDEFFVSTQSFFCAKISIFELWNTCQNKDTMKL